MYTVQLYVVIESSTPSIFRPKARSETAPSGVELCTHYQWNSLRAQSAILVLKVDKELYTCISTTISPSTHFPDSQIILVYMYVAVPVHHVEYV